MDCFNNPKWLNHRTRFAVLYSHDRNINQEMSRVLVKNERDEGEYMTLEAYVDVALRVFFQEIVGYRYGSLDYANAVVAH
jgi:hypothetical protein